MDRQHTRRPRRARRLALAMGAVFACLAVGVRAATASGASPAQIRIESFVFDPPTLEVASGATVTWINRDEELHAVTSAEGLFASPGIDTDEQFSFRFERPGTYEYRCALHPHMHGTVIVR